MIISANNYRVRVQYRVPGKFYNAGDQETGVPFNDAEKSSYPFDEFDVEIGASFDTKDYEVVGVREFTPVAPSGPEFTGG